jgi:hypothetical protein
MSLRRRHHWHHHSDDAPPRPLAARHAHHHSECAAGSLLLRLHAGVGSSRERSETGLPCARKRRYTTAEAVVYLHGDHLGSTSLTTNATGGIVAQSRYLPYGQERLTDGPAQTDLTFTGQRADNYTHLIEMGARW